MQLWQADGLGTDKNMLEKVLRTFRSDGVQGIKSQQALCGYLQKLSDDSLREMFRIDMETTLQILVDCFGAMDAFNKFTLIDRRTDKDEREWKRQGWITPSEYKEAVEKYEEQTEKLNEEKDRILSDYTRAAQKAEDAEIKISLLQEEITHYKADLYDFYAKMGKLPDYEGRYRKW